MARARLKVYETEQLPIPNPRKMSDEEKAEIKTKFDQLIKRENELGDDVSVEKTEKERDELDRSVLSAIDMEDRLDDIKNGVEQMLRMREQAAGEDTEVLVDRPSKGEEEVIELAGVASARESTTLGDF